LRAGNENRTRIASLEGWSFTIKLCPRSIEQGYKGAMELPVRKAFFPDKILKRDPGGWFSPRVAGVLVPETARLSLRSKWAPGRVSETSRFGGSSRSKARTLRLLRSLKKAD
jgi:hypothetical protein